MVREDYHTFYQCWDTYRTEHVMFWDPLNFVVVVRDHDHIKVIFIDPTHHQHKRPVLIPDSDTVTDVRYRQDKILIIRDKRIEVLDVATDKQASSSIGDPYIFEQARFLENSDQTFVVLCKDPEKKKHTQLRLYRIV
jgi:hypothetical protein